MLSRHRVDLVIIHVDLCCTVILSKYQRASFRSNFKIVSLFFDALICCMGVYFSTLKFRSIKQETVSEPHGNARIQDCTALPATEAERLFQHFSIVEIISLSKTPKLDTHCLRKGSALIWLDWHLRDQVNVSVKVLYWIPPLVSMISLFRNSPYLPDLFQVAIMK